MRTANISQAQLPKPWTPFPASGTCKVMPVGTSISKGLYGDGSQDSRGGYRGPLLQRCQSANSRVDFVGSQAGPSGTGSGHEGYGGTTIAAIASIIAARCTTYTPHAVPIELGMNDPATAPSATSLMTDVVDLVIATLPNALILVQAVIPIYTPGTYVPYNAQLALEVANRRAAGKHVEFVDEYNQSGLVPGTRDYSEAVTWIHPSAIGYPKMARPLFDHLAKYL